MHALVNDTCRHDNGGAGYTAASFSGTLVMRRSLLFLVCLALVALAGCGRKGPLYLPPPAAATPTTVAPAPAASTAAAPAAAQH
jgi:predicted small lipoprotein YifL